MKIFVLMRDGEPYSGYDDAIGGFSTRELAEAAMKNRADTWVEEREMDVCTCPKDKIIKIPKKGILSVFTANGNGMIKRIGESMMKENPYAALLPRSDIKEIRAWKTQR